MTDTPTARDLLPESEALLKAAAYGQQIGWFVMEGQSEWLRAQLAAIEAAARADAADAAQQEVARLREALVDIEGRRCQAAVWHDIPDRWLVCMDPDYNDDEPVQPCPPCTARAALAHPGPSPEADARCVFAMEDMGSCGWYDIWSGHQPPFGDPDYAHHTFTPAQPEAAS